MKRIRRDGFTLLELMAVIAIIFALAGIMMAAADAARRSARKKRSEATIEVLATGCEAYWTIYRDYPYPNPDSVGLGAIQAFRDEYYDGDNSIWTTEGYNVTLVWMLSRPRQPEPLISVQQRWFKKIDKDVKGPDGRTLYKVVDGFQNVIKVERPSQYYYVNTYVRLISAGADGEFGEPGPDGVWGTEDDTEPARDDIRRYIKR